MEKPGIFLEASGSFLSAAAGLWVYGASGLPDVAESGIVKVALGAAVALWFAMNFRVAIHGK